MEIKRTLKNLDVRISRLASDLGISRPTLDTYINYYDSGRQIPNQLYQEIFDYLFSSANMSTVEFAKRFDYVKKTYLQSRKSQTQSKEQELRDNIACFSSDADVSMELLEFINLFITNQNNDLVMAICNYFNYVNGLKKYKPDMVAEKDKAFFSHLFALFADYQSNKLEFDSISYSDFIDKCNRIYEKKHGDTVNEELIDYLQKNLDGGSSIDIEYVKKLLKKKED